MSTMSQPKTPVSELKEYCDKYPDVGTVVYEEIETIAQNSNILFQCKVTIGTVTQIGQGKSKKEAKHDAARKIMEHICESKGVSQSSESPNRQSATVSHCEAYTSPPPSYLEATAEHQPVQLPSLSSMPPSASGSTVLIRQPPPQPSVVVLPQGNDVLPANIKLQLSLDVSYGIPHKIEVVGESSTKCTCCGGKPGNGAVNNTVNGPGDAASPPPMTNIPGNVLTPVLSSNTPSPITPKLAASQALVSSSCSSQVEGQQPAASITNCIGYLKELSEKGGIPAPSYSERTENGQHSCVATIQDGDLHLSQTGFGATKKIAKQNAAQLTIEELRTRRRELFSADTSQ